MAQSIVLFLHNLFTAVWIGGLFMLAMTVIPIVRGRLANPQEGSAVKAMELFSEITLKHRKWVFVSIAGLFITGLMLSKVNDPGGFMKFGNQYQILASVKHIATFLMIIVAVVRILKVSGKLDKGKPAKKSLGIPLIYANFALGVIVLLLSAMMASL